MTAVFQALFASVPSFDLWVSSLFWTAEGGFHFTSLDSLKQLRAIGYHAFTAMAVLALIGALVALKQLKLLTIPGSVWLFIVGVYVFGPGLLVHSILKAHWGRARPAQVLEFGGDLLFSPPFEIAAQCTANCSFVSGEAAGATAFAIAAYSLTRFVSSPALRRTLFGLALCLAVSCAFLRVVFGGHFLSDVIFSALFVSLIAVGLSFFLSDRTGALTSRPKWTTQK
ncbi:MAG: phosphatase PAP2 family protein [Shimia sp.]|uniref:phosphatase PAP2 family protein n=1 Tax=Shimia sp. TaxID=1954381 RepID=UPI003B8B5998